MHILLYACFGSDMDQRWWKQTALIWMNLKFIHITYINEFKSNSLGITFCGASGL